MENYFKSLNIFISWKNIKIITFYLASHKECI